MKLINKSTLAAAIKKRYMFLERKKGFNPHNKEYEIRMSECQHLMLIFNTIETKEVDLEKESLTWEDIPELLSISEQLKTSWWFRDRTKEIGTQVFWEEVLKQFKAQKGE